MLASHYHYVSVLVLVVMIVVETGRLYLAYEGNLREKVQCVSCTYVLDTCAVQFIYNVHVYVRMCTFLFTFINHICTCVCILNTKN